MVFFACSLLSFDACDQSPCQTRLAMRPHHLAMRGLAPAAPHRALPARSTRSRAAPTDDAPTTSTAASDRPARPSPEPAAAARDAASPARKGFGLGDVLGPIGLTIGKSAPERGGVEAKVRESWRGNARVGGSGEGRRRERCEGERRSARASARRRLSAKTTRPSLIHDPHTPTHPHTPLQRASFTELGPIGITVGPSVDGPAAAALSSSDDGFDATSPPGVSVSTMTTAEWRQTYESDGCVDLWVEEEFNSGSRLVGGRAAHFGRTPGAGSGEGATGNTAAVKHSVRIVNAATGQDIEVTVPEDR